MNKVYFAARYDKGTADYINCPFTKEEYDRFLDALTTAETVPAKDLGTNPNASRQNCHPERSAPSEPQASRMGTESKDLRLIPQKLKWSPKNSNTSKAVSPSKRPPAAAATPFASAR